MKKTAKNETKQRFYSSKNIGITFVKEGDKCDTVGIEYFGMFFVVKMFASEKTDTGLYASPSQYKYNGEYQNCFSMKKELRIEIEEAYNEYMEKRGDK